MPIIRVDLWEGRPKEKKKELIEKLTETTCNVLGCSKTAVIIVLSDIKKENWGDSGKQGSEI